MNFSGSKTAVPKMSFILSPRILECDCHPHLHSVVLRRAKRVTNLRGFSHGKFQDSLDSDLSSSQTGKGVRLPNLHRCIVLEKGGKAVRMR